MRLGILGGTFNPIHLAHLQIARDVLAACRLDRVLFVPAADPPHKPVADNTAFRHRLAMVDAAIADEPLFFSTDLEARRKGKSYSVETLQQLKQQDPEGQLYFIIGLDSYRDIASWREYSRLFELAQLVVVNRPGVQIGDPLEALPVAMRDNFCYDAAVNKMRHKSGNYVIFLKETKLDISSTNIRRRAAAGLSIGNLVPAAVADYISRHALYQSTREGSR